MKNMKREKKKVFITGRESWILLNFKREMNEKNKIFLGTKA